MKDPADTARRRTLAALLWAVRRERRTAAALTAALVDDLVDLRVLLRQATAWRTPDKGEA
jgi:hypothetical protein